MNKRYIGIFGILAALAMLVSFLPQSTPVAKAGDQVWSDITMPSIINAGKIRALAVVDSNSAFAATTNAVTAAGASTSFLVRTIDGGVTWTPVGNFDNGNGSAPTEIRGTSGSETTAPQLQATTTELYLAVSPNYAADKTLVVAINDPTTTVFQMVFRSKDGGDTFKIIGGTNVVTSPEIIRTISVAPNYTETTDNSILLGTINTTDNATGGFYFYQTGFGGSFGSKQGAGDIYAAKYTGGNSIVAIGVVDNAVGDDPVSEFRITAVSGTLQTALSALEGTASGVAIGSTVQGSTTQENHRFDVAFPSNWSAGTTTDRNVIVHSIGGATPTGAIFRRQGSTAGYDTATTSTSFGFATAGMSGNATTGSVFVGTDTAAAESSDTPQPKVVYSVDGGVTWSSITSGDRYGLDGVGVRTQVGMGSGSAVFAGTGGIRGGIYKSPNLGVNWVDNAVYSDNITGAKDFNLVDANNIFLVLTVGATSSQETHSFKTENGGVSWRRVMRTAGIAKIRSGAAPNSYWAMRDKTPAGAAAVDGQVRRSTDGGFTWTTTPADPSDTLSVKDITSMGELAIFLVMSNAQIAYTADGGSSWTISTTSPSVEIGGPDSSPTYSSADKPGYQTIAGFAKSNGTTWISRDNGVSWAQYGAAPFSGTTQGNVKFSKSYETDKIIYVMAEDATPSDGGTFKLVDDGTVNSTSSWVQVYSSASVLAGSGTGLASTKFGTLFQSGKAVWQPIGSVIAMTFDITKSPVEWRRVPVVDSAGAAATRISAKKNAAGQWVHWTWGASNTFKTLVDTSTAPTLLFPMNGSGGVARVAALSWSSVPNATEYDVQLGLTPNLEGAETDTTSALGRETSQYAVGAGDGMTPGGVFYWRVRERSPMESAWSPIWSFTVAGGPTPAPATPTPGPTDKLMLKSGWNLVSLPKSLASSKVGDVFKNVTTIEKAYGFSGGTWNIATFAAAAWSGTLTDLTPGAGYWVKTTADTTVNLAYKPVDPLDPPPAYDLAAGWSLVGYTTLALTPNQPVSVYLTSLAGKWTSLYNFNAATGYGLAKPGYGFSNVTMFEGYWIYLTSAGTLVP